MMRNKDVVRAWAQGRPGQSTNLWTNGSDLYSYELKIGFTGEDGLKYVYNYTAKPDRNWMGNRVEEKFISQTTSCHVGLAKKVGYICSPPNERETEARAKEAQERAVAIGIPDRSI